MVKTFCGEFLGTANVRQIRVLDNPIKEGILNYRKKGIFLKWLEG